MLSENVNNKLRFFIKSFVLVVLLFLGFYTYTISSNIVTYFNNHMLQDDKYCLKDLWRDLIGHLDIRKNKIFYAIINFIPWILVFITSIAIINQLRIKKESYLVHIILGENILIILNGIAQIITILPDSNLVRDVCNSNKYKNLGFWIFTRISADNCGDMMWSGHTYHTIFMLIILYWILNEHEYFLKNFVIRIIFYLFSVFIVLLEMNGLVSLGIHYSVDVYISLIITPLFLSHNKYHELVDKTKEWINK